MIVAQMKHSSKESMQPTFTCVGRLSKTALTTGCLQMWFARVSCDSRRTLVEGKLTYSSNHVCAMFSYVRGQPEIDCIKFVR